MASCRSSPIGSDPAYSLAIGCAVTSILPFSLPGAQARLGTYSKGFAASPLLGSLVTSPYEKNVFEGYDASSDNIADLVHALEDTLRCVRQLVLYSPGPDAIRSRDQAETIYLARVV